MRLVCLREWMKAMQDHMGRVADGRHAPSLIDLDIDGLADDEIDRYALTVSREMRLPS